MPEPGEGRPITRRDVLRIIGTSVAVSAATAAGGKFLLDQYVKSQTPQAPDFKFPTPHPDTKLQSGEKELSRGTNKSANNRVITNADNLPVRAILEPLFSKRKEDYSKKIIYFDPEQARESRGRALTSGNTELFTVIPINANRDIHSSLRGQDRLKQIPPDVLTPEQLAQRGVTIIQSETTNLQIRKGALEKGEPLEHFSKDGRKLNIVLIDGRVVDQAHMQDKKYDAVRKFAPQRLKSGIPAQIRRELLAKEGKRIPVIKSEKGKTADKFYQERLLAAQEAQYKLASVYTDEDILLYETGFLTKGYYTEDKANNTANIFLAVGMGDERDILSLYFNPKGEFKAVASPNRIMGYSPHPKYHQSYPQGSMDFKLDYDKDTQYYVFALEAPPGFTLRHELKHEFEDREAVVDRAVLADYKAAWQKWDASDFGKKDPSGNSGYHFVFSLPQNEHEGFILN